MADCGFSLLRKDKQRPFRRRLHPCLGGDSCKTRDWTGGRPRVYSTPSTIAFREFSRPLETLEPSLHVKAAVVEPGEQTLPRSYSLGKLAGTRESTFRFLRSVIATHSTTPKTGGERTPSTPDSRSRNTSVDSSVNTENGGEEMPPPDFPRATSQTTTYAPRTRSTLQDFSRVDSGLSGRGIKTSSNLFPEEKPLAAGNGVSISVNLAEPMLFLQGIDQHDLERHDPTQRSTAMLRGNLRLRVAKSAKIKAISLTFRGTATTKWPEGIPPKKIDFEEVNTLMSHTWPFFNAQFPNAEGGSCADHVRLATGQNPKISGDSSPYSYGTPRNSSMNLTGRDAKRLTMQVNHKQSRSFDRSEGAAKTGVSVAQKGYRTFHPGDYIYNFELPIDSRLPETIDLDLGTVKYELEATVERAGAFRANLMGTKEVTLIRAPSEGSLEQVEPIAISRNWEDQLHYDIVISGKSFPLGSKIPIAFKLTPLAKVNCHRVKVYITENSEYFCSNRRVHRMEPTRKVLLYEKRADGPGVSTFPGSSMRITAGGGVPYDQREAAARGEAIVPQDTSNMLGRLDADASVGPTEMEMNVQLPGCTQANEKDGRMNKLHFDTTCHDIQVHHWIKIVMRLSKPDENDPTKRRHFEISIDSPFHILSCRATQANTSLPSYSSEEGPNDMATLADCGCPGAPRRRISPTHVPTLNALNGQQTSRSLGPDLSSNEPSTTGDLDSDATAHASGRAQLPSLARPPTAHVHNDATRPVVQRPIHMMRAPSFNPPSFEDDEPPPPLVTPPPQYNDIASPTDGHGLADYFSRLAETYHDDADANESHDSSDSDSISDRLGRVRVPLTPGSRVNRSMDAHRSWVPVGQ